MKDAAKTNVRPQRWLWLCRRSAELLCAIALLLLSLVLLSPDQRESIRRIEFKEITSLHAADVCRGCGVQAELSLEHFQFQIQFQIRIQPWAGLTLDYRTSGLWSFGLLDWVKSLSALLLPDKQWTVAGHFPDTQYVSASCRHLPLLQTADNSHPTDREIFSKTMS
ncbi:hypothetical protein KDM87_10485 [Undibacterium sp. FT147W]|uniref:Uncharacterized protein n=1 Tax=Undibacterium rivi TaxID=2828729 RepID=A0ABS5H4K2_9BURK|nr:hypothetical protein [Undibacterium rivi]MBR7793024.1 hypothetical protein [Undibacterium rivi]